MLIDQERYNYYCEQLSSENNSVLNDLERNISLHSTDPGLSSDFAQGRLLSFISKLLSPKKVLEIGTFWGYATICLSEGLAQNGSIHTLEKNTSLKSKIDVALENSNISEKVRVIYGPAMDSLMSLDLNSYDLFFIDAAKKEYDKYYEKIVSNARKGAIVILDNVLWKGMVLDPSPKGIAKSMHMLNQKIEADSRVENFILPLRDGLNVLTVL